MHGRPRRSRADTHQRRQRSGREAGALPPNVSDQVLSRLLGDSHVGVRKFAIKSTSDRNGEAIKRRIQQVATTDADSGLRQIAAEKARSVSPP
jgi:hypothetical protein